jgi:hypothetical protein
MYFAGDLQEGILFRVSIKGREFFHGVTNKTIKKPKFRLFLSALAEDGDIRQVMLLSSRANLSA